MKTIFLAMKILIVSLDTIRYRMLNRVFDTSKQMSAWIAGKREEIRKQIIITILVGIVVCSLMGLFIWAVESRINHVYRKYDPVSEVTVNQIEICEGLHVEVSRF